MKHISANWAVIIPLANEEKDFEPFICALRHILTQRNDGAVYLVVDNASIDSTRELCLQLSSIDKRFVTVWAPENRNVVDAYIRGYEEAYRNGHEIIIEMDAGLSHDPSMLPAFIHVLETETSCAFGSRFVKGGAMIESSFFRRFLSKGGTIISNLLLGTALSDMTSGYQGFRREVVGDLLNYKLHSRAHFYQTEVRYLLRKRAFTEIPIIYKAPSPRVSPKAIANSLSVLFHYFIRRLLFRPASL